MKHNLIVLALAGLFGLGVGVTLESLKAQPSMSGPVMVYSESAVRWFETELTMISRKAEYHTITEPGPNGTTITNGVFVQTNVVQQQYRLGLRPDNVLVAKQVP